MKTWRTRPPSRPPPVSLPPGRLALKPGATWTGMISGTGQLAASRPSLYARVVFGPLTGVAGQTAPVYWITDHSKTLPAVWNRHRLGCAHRPADRRLTPARRSVRGRMLRPV